MVFRSTPQPDRPAQIPNTVAYGTAGAANLQYPGYGNAYHMQGQGNPYSKTYNQPSTQPSYMPPPHQ